MKWCTRVEFTHDGALASYNHFIRKKPSQDFRQKEEEMRRLLAWNGPGSLYDFYKRDFPGISDDFSGTPTELGYSEAKHLFNKRFGCGDFEYCRGLEDSVDLDDF